MSQPKPTKEQEEALKECLGRRMLIMGIRKRTFNGKDT